MQKAHMYKVCADACVFGCVGTSMHARARAADEKCPGRHMFQWPKKPLSCARACIFTTSSLVAVVVVVVLLLQLSQPEGSSHHDLFGP